MKRLVVELDDKLHKKVKFRAFQCEKTMKNYVIALIEKDLEEKEKE